MYNKRNTKDCIFYMRHNLINYKYIYKIPDKLYIQENKDTIL